MDATKTWVSLVRDGATWDFKVDFRRSELPKNITIGDVNLNYQAVANIHFGAIGRAAGFTEEFLLSGAGVFHVYDNGIKRGDWGNVGALENYFDDPYDAWMIRFGSWLYDNIGEKFGFLSDKDLTEAMKKYIQENGYPGEPISP